MTTKFPKPPQLENPKPKSIKFVTLITSRGRRRSATSCPHQTIEIWRSHRLLHLGPRSLLCNRRRIPRRRFRWSWMRSGRFRLRPFLTGDLWAVEHSVGVGSRGLHLKGWKFLAVGRAKESWELGFQLWAKLPLDTSKTLLGEPSWAVIWSGPIFTSLVHWQIRGPRAWCSKHYLELHSKHYLELLGVREN